MTQLLAPASEALRNPCLTGPITAYSWVEAICLMSIFVLFFVELLTMRYTTGFTHPTNKSESEQASSSDPAVELSPNNDNDKTTPDSSSLAAQASSPHHHDALASSFPAQLAGVFILEFGVIFHSVFIGLTLAVSGAEFPTLYVVLVFHQTFEGLAIGSRLATIDWPRSKRRTPYFLGLAYALSTPIAIAAGLAVRASLEVGGASFLIINGVFDAISAGILIYTGLVELMVCRVPFAPALPRTSSTNPPTRHTTSFSTRRCIPHPCRASPPPVASCVWVRASWPYWETGRSRLDPLSLSVRPPQSRRG